MGDKTLFGRTQTVDRIMDTGGGGGVETKERGFENDS